MKIFDSESWRELVTLHLDTAFGNTALMGPVYAQPLYLAGSGGKPNMVVVASEPMKGTGGVTPDALTFLVNDVIGPGVRQ